MARVSVIHHVPGRVRVRLPAELSGRAIEQRIRQHAGITACRSSRSARSLVIEYEPREADVSAILDVLADVLGVPPEAIDDTEAPMRGPLSNSVLRAVGRLDQRVADVTRHHLDLQSLLALSLVAWAVRQIIRGRARELPWSAALWYAYELFRHRAHRAPGQAAISSPPESL